MLFARRISLAAICTLGVLLAASSAQAQQYKLLPNDTEMIVTINVQQILKSEVMKGNKELLDVFKSKVNDGLEDKGVAKYLTKADFDLFRDLSSITLAIPGGRSPEEGFIILEGKFDADKIEAAATDASTDAGGGLRVTKIGGIKAFEVSPKGEKTVYIGVLNKKTMIATATKADFADAVARFNGSKESNIKAEVKSLLETVNNKQSISAVATGPVLVKLMENAPAGAGGNQAQAAIATLKQLDGLSFSITIQKNIDFQVGITTQDDKTASKFADLSNIMITGLRLQIAQQAMKDEKLVPVSEVLNTLRATAQRNNLVIRGQVSFETLGKALQNLPIPK